jgi:splicing factor 3B subunit 5
MAGTDRFNVNVSLGKNWEHLQTKFVGTGHPDLTRHEWAVNHHRDTYASLLGHSDQLAYVAVAENESIGRTKFKLLEKMLQPCGPPPVLPSEKK